jgi:A118 family predicted phage portal protein
MNEKVRITLGNEGDKETLNKILNDNNFWVKSNQGIEKTFALETGYFLLFIDDNKVKIQFVTVPNIYPLRFDSDKISECAFTSYSFDFDSVKNEAIKVCNLQIHSLDKNENYVINNFKFEILDAGTLSPLPLDKKGSR